MRAEDVPLHDSETKLLTMKRSLIFTAAIAMLLACMNVFAQELKPLKSFNGNEQEYMRGNFKEDNTLFKGKTFKTLMSELEVDIHSTMIQITDNKSKLYVYLYLQDPDMGNYEQDHGVIANMLLMFEDGASSKDDIQTISETFPFEYGDARLRFTKELSAQLAVL